MTPDLQRIQEELNAAAIEWVEPDDVEPKDAWKSYARLYTAARAFQEAQKPEQLCRIYFHDGTGHRVVYADTGYLRRRGQELGNWTDLHIHPLDPSTGLAGPELTPEEVKALLEETK